MGRFQNSCGLGLTLIIDSRFWLDILGFVQKKTWVQRDYENSLGLGSAFRFDVFLAEKFLKIAKFSVIFDLCRVLNFLKVRVFSVLSLKILQVRVLWVLENTSGFRG